MPEITGWRTWKIDLVPSEDKGRLYFRPTLTSVNSQMSWDSPTIRSDVPPARDNTNGIYSWKTKLQALREYPNHSVYGEIALSGHVCEHNEGYRAERVTIRRLFLVAQSNRFKAEILVTSRLITHVAELAKMFEDLYECTTYIIVQHQTEYLDWKQWQDKLKTLGDR